MKCPTCSYTCTRIVYHTRLEVLYVTGITNIYPQTCCVAFSRVAEWQYLSTRTTIRGLSPDLCNVGNLSPFLTCPSPPPSSPAPCLSLPAPCTLLLPVAYGGSSQGGIIVGHGGTGSRHYVTDGDDTDDEAYTSAEGQEDDGVHTPSPSQSSEHS